MKRLLTAAYGLLTLFSISACVQTTQTAQLSDIHPLAVDQPEWNLSDYEQGMLAWKKGQAVNAARHFKDAYTLNDPKAEAMLGLLYVKGSGVFKSAEVGRAYAIAVDQRPDFDAFTYYSKHWRLQQDPDAAYLIAWLLANRFSGQARADYELWITVAADLGHPAAIWEVANYLN